MSKAAIYAIRHIANDKRYIGSSARYQGRFRAHKYLLRHGKHHSPQLQRTWERDGENAFVFEVLEPIESLGDLIVREQFYIDLHKAADDRFGYNVGAVAGSRRGVAQPPGMSAISSALHRGKPKSAEHRAKISAAQKGRKISEEQKALARINAKKQFSSPEARQLASDRAKTRWDRDGERAAAVERGKASMTPEVRAIISAKSRERWADPDKRAVYVAAAKAAMTPEVRAKISEAKMGQPCSPEARRNMSDAHKARYAADPELRQRKGDQLRIFADDRAKAIKGVPLTDEHKAALRAGQARRRAMIAETK